MFGEDGYEAGGYSMGGVGALAEDDFTSGGTTPGLFAGTTEEPAFSPGGFFGGLLSSGERKASVRAPSGLKLRAAPTEHSAELGLFRYGSEVTVLEDGLPSTPAAPKGWSKVKTATGKDGFMSSEWLSVASPGAPAPALPPLPPSLSLPAALPKTAPPASSSKLLWIGGGVVALLVVVAVVLGSK